VILFIAGMCLASAKAESSAAPDYAMDQALPVSIAPNDANIHLVGRFDDHDPKNLRFAWPASEVSVHFIGTDLNIQLDDGGNSFDVLIDGHVGPVLKAKSGTHLYRVASALPQAEHIVQLVKRTEAFCGVVGFKGVQLSQGGKLLPIAPHEHRIEVIGDSISAGYGDEAASQKEHFTPATENARLAYGALAARAFDADYVCIAWSGKTLWPKNTIVELYDRTLPGDAHSKWDFASYQPQVIVINLGTNDTAKGIPDEEGWVKAYNDFLDHLRANDPKATIYLAIGPMMTDSASKPALSTIRKYITRVVKERSDKGDSQIHLLEFKQQTWKNGFGADWHPSLKTHQLMADDLINAIQHDLGWMPLKGK
jgi:lysophospholipase L1-like esterase